MTVHIHYVIWLYVYIIHTIFNFPCSSAGKHIFFSQLADKETIREGINVSKVYQHIMYQELWHELHLSLGVNTELTLRIKKWLNYEVGGVVKSWLFPITWGKPPPFTWTSRDEFKSACQWFCCRTWCVWDLLFDEQFLGLLQSEDKSITLDKWWCVETDEKVITVVSEGTKVLKKQPSHW